MSKNFYKSLDLVVDFATLGEYRVIGDCETGARSNAVSADESLWAADVDWQSAPRTREIECSLPRARDRARARASIRS